ncbi:YD repeat-containing protein [Desulfuromusa kysingii]|uniref:YD repeat-containing protein n=1 Tax=Desulfuromusa kysingii TaxID=37625 RepID=A0A1H4BL41_9BACT|nr:hypothetical protein [Desulfuromusa kysingii]SEA48883.1 YD repeat-containing protein [Desulfuromusa kysingii]
MKQRCYSHYSYFLVMLILLPLVLSGCGGSSSNHEITASQYPYGADSIATTTTKGDTYIQSFEYNSAMQVIGQVIEETSYADNDGDPVPDTRFVQSYTYDPAITGTSILYDNNLAPVAQESALSSNFGAITSLIQEWYYSDEETGVMDTTPSIQEESHYSYTPSGLPLKQTEVNDGITTDTYTFTYNSAEDITSFIHTEIDDTSSTTVHTFEYDSYGNLISHIVTADGDVTKEDSYTHSYADGLKMQTIVDKSDEDIYQIDFTYNDKKQLISKKTSTDVYDNVEGYDTFSLHTYIYDSAGRLLTDSETYSYSNDNDETIDYLRHYYQAWEYNEQGLLTMSSTEQYSYPDPINETLSSHYGDINSYTYADSGNLAMHSYENLLDADNDGVFEGTSQYWSDEYSYNDAGYLTVYTHEEKDYPGGELSSTRTETNIVTYSDGILTKTVEVNFEDGSETFRQSNTFTYDDSGQLVSVETDEDDTDNQTTSLTYNDDQTVTLLSEEDEMPMIVDFTSEGIPTGTADVTFDSPTIVEYPNAPEIDEYYSASYVADDNDKTYLKILKVPKMLEFIYNRVESHIK